MADLREPVALSPEFEQRVMAALATVEPPSRMRRLPSRWMWGVASVAAAAAVLIAVRVGSHSERSLPQAVRFQVDAGSAHEVTVVGDFNDWDRSRTHLSRSAPDQPWTVTLELARGRYRYAFLVDGSKWISDPTQPVTPDVDFGQPMSVVTVEHPTS